MPTFEAFFYSEAFLDIDKTTYVDLLNSSNHSHNLGRHQHFNLRHLRGFIATYGVRGIEKWEMKIVLMQSLFIKLFCIYSNDFFFLDSLPTYCLYIRFKYFLPCDH